MALESWIEFIRSSKHHVSVKLERWYGGTPENGGQNEDKWGPMSLVASMLRAVSGGESSKTGG